MLYGLPIANLLVILSASGLVGSLLLAVIAFSATSSKPEYGRALDVASASAAVLTVSSAATTFFNLQTVYPDPLSSICSTARRFPVSHGESALGRRGS